MVILVVLGTLGALSGTGALIVGLVRQRTPTGWLRSGPGATATWAARGLGLIGAQGRVEQAAEILELPVTVLARRAGLGACVGSGVGMALGVLVLLGTAPGWAVGVAGLLGGALVGGALGGLGIVGEALRRASRMKSSLVQATGVYLDLVGLHLAGGAGLEQALVGASTALAHPLGRRLQVALEAAARRGEAPWVALRKVGEATGSPALVELATTVTVAGTEGAQIRRSLAAKAKSLRLRQLADVEAAERAAGERLFLPSSLLLLGFLVLVGYPALARILHGL